MNVVKVLFGLLILLLAPALSSCEEAQSQSEAVLFKKEKAFANFIEPHFPFVMTALNERDNLTVRGPVLQLDHGLKACFDTDLLRMSVVWQGKMSLTGMSMISYQTPANKKNNIPQVSGRVLTRTSYYAGWQASQNISFSDPRAPQANPLEVGRGPIKEKGTRWSGLRLKNKEVSLSYSIRGNQIQERPRAILSGKEVGFERNFLIKTLKEDLDLVISDFADIKDISIKENNVLITDKQDKVTAITFMGPKLAGKFVWLENKHLVLRLKKNKKPLSFKVLVWQGEKKNISAFEAMKALPLLRPESRGKIHKYWPETIITSGNLSKKKKAFVIDEIPLPLKNPWNRQLRLAALDFFDDGRAAVLTFDGDVWIVSGLDAALKKVSWQRFASGLNEPLTIRIVNGQIYVGTRAQITRLHDKDGNGEADFYENFCNLVIQSGETRENLMALVPKAGGGFYVSKGGALSFGPKGHKMMTPGFRPGAAHSGVIVEISKDGRAVEVFATGLREPYLSIDPQTQTLTASDQQGHFVPTTPLYLVNKGDYFGVPATAHQKPIPPITPPLCWIPHEVDGSGMRQVWLRNSQLGPLNNSLLHLSYTHGQLYKVFINKNTNPQQAAILPLDIKIPTALMMAELHPKDGLLYMLGFKVWGSYTEKVSGFYRLRYQKKETVIIKNVTASDKGVLIEFYCQLDKTSVYNMNSYEVKRWNFERTSRYGFKDLYKTNGDKGRELLTVNSATLSKDEKSIFLSIPNMKTVKTMSVSYYLKSKSKKTFFQNVYLTLHSLPASKLKGFKNIDHTKFSPRSKKQKKGKQKISVALGEKIYKTNCLGCHSINGTKLVGPSFKGLFRKKRKFTRAKSQKADEKYLRESIIDPAAKIVKGFAPGMPFYSSQLTKEEIDSVILYIKSLK
jgi:mono/diheme cytochrome c family protein